MSGARPGGGVGATLPACSVARTGARAKRCPAARATRANSAMAATAQGSTVPTPEGRSGWAPAGVPQRWQNFAPGVSAARQDVHAAPARGAPQVEQNFPAAAAPQDGHCVAVGVDIGTKSKRRSPLLRSTRSAVRRARKSVRRSVPPSCRSPCVRCRPARPRRRRSPAHPRRERGAPSRWPWSALPGRCLRRA